MINDKDLDRLVSAMREYGVTTLEIEWEDERLRLVLPAADAPVTAAFQVPTAAVTSPGMGAFLPRGGDDGLAPLATGTFVGQGDVLGYICQGPVRVPIVSSVAGTLIDGLPDEGTVLGYCDNVCSVDPEL